MLLGSVFIPGCPVLPVAFNVGALVSGFADWTRRDIPLISFSGPMNILSIIHEPSSDHAAPASLPRPHILSRTTLGRLARNIDCRKFLPPSSCTRVIRRLVFFSAAAGEYIGPLDTPTVCAGAGTEPVRLDPCAKGTGLRETIHGATAHQVRFLIPAPPGKA